jgi:hypothetical protein
VRTTSVIRRGVSTLTSIERTRQCNACGLRERRDGQREAKPGDVVRQIAREQHQHARQITAGTDAGHCEHADECRGHQHHAHCGGDAERLAGAEGGGANTETEHLTQRALFTLAGESAEPEQDDQQGHQQLQRGGRRECAEPLCAGGVLRGPELILVLLVRFQPRRHTHIRIDTIVERGERGARLERVDAVMRRRMWILRRLRQPVRTRQLARRVTLGRQQAGLLHAVEQ